MLTWFKDMDSDSQNNDVYSNYEDVDGMEANFRDKLKFEAAVGQLVSLFGYDIEIIQQKLSEAFKGYLEALYSANSGNQAETRMRVRRK